MFISSNNYQRKFTGDNLCFIPEKVCVPGKISEDTYIEKSKSSGIIERRTFVMKLVLLSLFRQLFLFDLDCNKFLKKCHIFRFFLNSENKKKQFLEIYTQLNFLSAKDSLEAHVHEHVLFHHNNKFLHVIELELSRNKYLFLVI